MRRSAWLIADSRRCEFPLLGAQYARLFGFKSRWRDAARSPVADIAFSRPHLILIGYQTLTALDASSRRVIQTLVQGGTTLYVRGGFPAGGVCGLAPFASSTFRPELLCHARAWRIAAGMLVPDVLAGEVASGDFALPAAEGLREPVQAMALAEASDGRLNPFVFGLPYKSGVVIYDLMPDQPGTGAEIPIVYRLSHPARRAAEIGALMAVRIATGRDPHRRPAMNLSVDDRPANYDYFNHANLGRWLDYVDRLLPGARVDFAWVPRQSRPAAGYLKAMRRFNAGFVWHGLYRHVDHRRLADLATELTRGLRALEGLSVRHGVEFQPIMVFPFENFDHASLQFLERSGFVATLAQPEDYSDAANRLPSYLHRSTPLDVHYLDCFPVLHRYSPAMLTRELMLAQLALDLPILVGAHPDELGLQRWAFIMSGRRRDSRLDDVLRFAAEKQLRPQSAEQIAAEILARPRPVAEEPPAVARLLTWQ